MIETVTVLGAAALPSKRCSIPAGKQRFFLHQNVETVPGPHPASCSRGTGEALPGSKTAGVWLTTSMKVVPTSRINGITLPHTRTFLRLTHKQISRVFFKAYFT
jgi:hypothetical protein